MSTIYVITDLDGIVLRWSEDSDQIVRVGEVKHVLVGPMLPFPALLSGRLVVLDGSISVVDIRTLAEAKTDKWTEIKAARQDAIDAPLVTPYGTFDCGPGDRSNITDAVALMQTMQASGTPITIDFTVRDNSTVTLTTAQMVNVGLLLGQKVQGAYATGRILRAQIDSPTVTKEELDEISWP